MPLPYTILAGDIISTGPTKINGNDSYLATLSVQPSGTTVNITVGASPFTYTAGASQEIVYISGGTVTSVTRHGIVLSNSFPLTVLLPPGESLIVTYTEAPMMVSDHS